MQKFKAVIFDLDGVITQTALVHSTAWKEMFDQFLMDYSKKTGTPFVAFTHEDDYLTYVDGKPRYEGVKSFLESRGIQLPYGNPDDLPEMETYCGVGNRKNIAFNLILERDGVQVYESTVALMQRLKTEGIHIGVASSSKNCESVLEAAGLMHFIETRVDGVVSAEMGLKGKPEPDIFTTAAANLGVNTDEAVVVEDAISGVQAARKGNFGLVLGLAREHNHQALLLAGADVVVSDMSEFGFEGIQNWFDNGKESDAWSLTYNDYKPENERSREALLSVGNGYFGTRGAFCDVHINAINYPATYMAGVYNRLTSQVSGKEIENEDFVNVSNWLPISFKINDGNWFDPNESKIIDIQRKIDFKSGLMTTQMKVEDQEGRQTMVYSRRFASMHNQHVAAIQYCLHPLNYSGVLHLRSQLVGNHINEGVKRYAELNQTHLMPHSEMAIDDRQTLVVCTTQSKVQIQQIARLEVMHNRDLHPVRFQHNLEESMVESFTSMEVKQGEYLGLIKTVFIEQKPINQALTTQKVAFENIESFDEEFKKSEQVWESIWKKMDIHLHGDRLTQKMLRMHIYHLMAGTSPFNAKLDFGIPARGLTGEAYRGHIFWDELYILPIYFVHYPEVAKAVLMYRYRRLDQARKYAAEFGYKGAMFPWQSGSDGREETQKFHFNPMSGTWGDDHSSLQRHVSLAVAYNIIQYWHFTQDVAFMNEAGMEMLVEIARFWESKSSWNSKNERYTIDKVMGPDEFHEAYTGSEHGGLRDNTYTNVMSAWLFEQLNLLLQLQWVDQDVLKTLNFNSKEAAHWLDIAQKLHLVINEEGILAQYDGYFDLKELDFELYHQKYGNVHRMDRVLKAEKLSPDDYKVAKQADTLMLYYNLPESQVGELIRKMGYQLPKGYVAKNLEYYLQRTSHGSTLSRVVHAFLAQKIGRYDLSWELFQEAVTSDFNDIQGGTTAEGIHTGVMAGTIYIMYAAFAGINFFGSHLSLQPSLPAHWSQLSFALTFKSVNYKFNFTQNIVCITADKAVKIEIKSKEFNLMAHQELCVEL